MPHMTEISCLIPLRRIGSKEWEDQLVPTEKECRSVAKRLKIPAVSALLCRYTITPCRGEEFVVRGHIRAEVVQQCVITLEDFNNPVDEDFTIRFVPQSRWRHEDSADPHLVDNLPYTGDHLDIGEVVIEQLSLALDPYPRKPGAHFETYHDGPDAQEERPNPFVVLAGLRKEKGDRGL